MERLSILERVEAGEGDETEFKSELGDLSRIGRAICAFANTRGGEIILGVNDSREIVGIREDSERVQERLTAFLHTGCSAPVNARLGCFHDAGGWVHWIEVPRQRGFEPLYYKRQIWIRRGRSNVEPSPVERQELYNVFGYIVFEECIVLTAAPSDIDLQHFRSYLRKLGLDTEEDPQPSDEDDLRNRGVIAEQGGELRGTLYGLFAFGKTPQSYPQTRSFWIECVAYGGDDRASSVLQKAEAMGRLDEQVRRATGWFAGLAKFESYDGLIRTDHPLVPEAALREALVNAVVHRDYAITGSKVLLEVFDRRVVVTSPGALPNNMSVESVRAGAHPRSRNESMANYIQDMGLMERRGRGWPLIRKAMREFNGTEPELEQNDRDKFVRVTFRFDRPGMK